MKNTKTLFLSVMIVTFLSIVSISQAQPNPQQKLPANFIGEHKIFAVLVHEPSGETTPLSGEKEKEARFTISNQEIKTQSLESLEDLSFGHVLSIEDDQHGTFLVELERGNKALIGLRKVQGKDGSIDVLMVGIEGDGRRQLTFMLEPFQ